MREFWRHLHWSLLWLYRGKWPQQDVDGRKITTPEAGTPLAGGYSACVWLIKGDLDYLAKTMHLESVTSHCCCLKCPANTSDMPWTDFHPVKASWLGSEYSDEAWLAQHPLALAIFTLPGVSISSIACDWMHSAHIGSYAYLYGSVLMHLTSAIACCRLYPGMTHLEAATAVWAEFWSRSIGAWV